MIKYDHVGRAYIQKVDECSTINDNLTEDEECDETDLSMTYIQPVARNTKVATQWGEITEVSAALVNPHNLCWFNATAQLLNVLTPQYYVNDLCNSTDGCISSMMAIIARMRTTTVPIKTENSVVSIYECILTLYQCASKGVLII